MPGVRNAFIVEGNVKGGGSWSRNRVLNPASQLSPIAGGRRRQREKKAASEMGRRPRRIPISSVGFAQKADEASETASAKNLRKDGDPDGAHCKRGEGCGGGVRLSLHLARAA